MLTADYSCLVGKGLPTRRPRFVSSSNRRWLTQGVQIDESRSHAWQTRLSEK